MASFRGNRQHLPSLLFVSYPGPLSSSYLLIFFPISLCSQQRTHYPGRPEAGNEASLCGGTKQHGDLIPSMIASCKFLCSFFFSYPRERERGSFCNYRSNPPTPNATLIDQAPCPPSQSRWKLESRKYI